MIATDERIVSCVARYISEHGYSPSVRDICRYTGITSPGAMKYRLERLREKGLLDYEDGMPRTIRPKGDA